MTRSILWISSRAPSSPVPIGWVALPQPRSRMALAADTRAVAVASLLRITRTSTLSAVLVWLRASERISVSDLAIWAYTYPCARGSQDRQGLAVRRRRMNTETPPEEPRGDGFAISLY